MNSQPFRKSFCLLLVTMGSAVVFAQDSSQSLQRVPPSASTPAPAPSPAMPSLDKIPFSQAVGILQENGASVQPMTDGSRQVTLPLLKYSSDPTRVSNSGQSSTQQRRADVPASFEPPQDVKLNATGSDAVRVSTQWQETHNTPAPGNDGRVLYTYGAGLPVLVCSPLRVCVVELQPGEKLVGEPHIGDSVRWEISPSQAGSGASAIALIIIKPQVSGLDTTMVLPTDRRAYYLRLESKPDEYIARVAFSYPNDGTQQWREYLEKQKQEEERARVEAVSQHVEDLPNTAIENMYWSYEIKGGNVFLRPVRVMDDGAKTYIQMPVSTIHRELPVLVVRGPAGAEMVNFRVKDNMYIVDRLFDRAALLMGSGKHQLKVEILRKQTVAGKGEAKAMKKWGPPSMPAAGQGGGQ
jgi:type IV secretion system protein TrbG